MSTGNILDKDERAYFFNSFTGAVITCVERDGMIVMRNRKNSQYSMHEKSLFLAKNLTRISHLTALILGTKWKLSDI